MDANSSDLRKRIDEWFDLHSGEMIGDLARLVAINSVRGLPETGKPYGAQPHAALMLARSMLEERGLAVSNFEDIIITADSCDKPARLGILAHLDIVEAGEGWETDPFTLTERDGMLFGRGTSDDKGPAVAAMYAVYCVRELFPELRHSVRLILGSGEETGCEDIARYIEKNDTPEFVFTPDSDFPVVNVEKGRFVPTFSASWEVCADLPRVVSVTGGRTANIVPNRAEAVLEGFTLSPILPLCAEYSGKTGAAISVREDGCRLVVTAEGKAAHASKPQDGLNAQTALLEMLCALPCAESEGFRRLRALSGLFPHGDTSGRALGIDMGDDVSGALTVNFGVLHFTEEGFTANFDSRTPLCADEADIEGVVRRALGEAGIKVTYVTKSKCHHTPADGLFVKTLLRIYEEYTGNKGECLAVGGTTYVHEVAGGVAFGCEMPGISNRIHGANEFIGAEQLVVSAKMFARAVADLCE